MLKRLSGGFNTNEPYLVPPSLQQQAPSQSPRSTPLSLPPSPARSAPPSPNNASSNQGSYFPLVPQVDRPTLHRSLGALSSLLVALDEVRDLAQRTAKAHKRVAKVEREIAASFGDKVENGARNDVIVAALGASAGMFEALSEVDAKHAKNCQREYEAANELAGKFFKRTAKEEKAYEEALGSLDQKVQKATMAYEKTRPRAPGASSPSQAVGAHDKYITSLSTLSSAISGLKQTHAESMGAKRDAAVKEVARIMCALAEASWKSRVNGTRKGGEKAGEVVSRGVWCDSGMRAPYVPEEEEDEEDAAARQRQSSDPQEQQQQQQQPQTGSMRGPRPLLPTNDSYSSYRPDPALFQPAQGLPSNTYLANLPSSLPPQSQSLQAPQQRERPRSSSPSLQAPQQRDRPRSTSPSRRPPVRQPSFESVRPATRVEAGSGGNSSNSTRHSFSPFSSEEDTSSNAQCRPEEGNRIVPPNEAMNPTNFDRERGFEREREAQGRQRAPSLDRRESTTSERNFVARMREKYNEEKERKGQAEDSRSTAGWETRSRADERSEPRSIVRSSSRVSTLAQRYSSIPTTTPPAPAVRPSHRHSHSMQPLSRPVDPSSSSVFNEFGLEFNRHAPDFSTIGSDRSRFSPPILAPFQGREAQRSYSRQSLDTPRSNAGDRPGSRGGGGGYPYSTSPTTMDRREAEKSGGEEGRHSSVCGCESCSASHYKSGGTTSAQDEERIQRELRGESQGRKMPAWMGGKR